MTDRPQEKQPQLNTSDFILSEQGFVTHYWIENGEYWKQFLPGGIHMSDRFPPRRIQKQQFDLAVGVYLSSRKQ